jgi:hypothetical protein
VGAISEWLCITSSPSSRLLRTALVRDEAGSGGPPELAADLRRDDEVALETTGNRNQDRSPGRHPLSGTPEFEGVDEAAAARGMSPRALFDETTATTAAGWALVLVPMGSAAAPGAGLEDRAR